MRILLVCTCRNDADIVELSIRRNLGFCDAIVVVDLNSVDGSREILADLRSEGLPIVVFDDPRLGVSEQARVTRVSRNAWRFFRPDRIILLRADELIVGRDRAAIEDELQQLVAEGDAIVSRRDLPPDTLPGDPIDQNLMADGDHSTSPIWLSGRVLVGDIVGGWEESAFHKEEGGQPPQATKLRSFSLVRICRRNSLQGELESALSWLDGELAGLGQSDAEALCRDLISYLATLDEGKEITMLGFRGDSQTGGDRDGSGCLVHGPTATQRPIESTADVVSAFRASLDRAVVTGSEGVTDRTVLERAPTGVGSVGDSGSLGAEFHSQNPYLDVPPFRFVWETYRPSAVLDLGCGFGGYLDMFRRWGTVEVIGVDDFDASGESSLGESYLRGDLRSRLDLGKKFDVVICTEVLEHIDPDFESAVLRNIAGHARTAIVFSAARPGQPGVGHVNCQPPEYWIGRWKDLGWTPEPFESLAMRSLSTFYWFRRNLLMLIRADGHSKPFHGYSLEDLDSLEARFIPWLGEAPCVYTFPLAVELPTLEDKPGPAHED
jgi:SAM-dependent methyltransferase